MAQRKNPELDAKHQAILRKMMQMPENKTCADCKGPSPRWASTNLGIFLCISCSGIHRKLGTHISQVRSVTLDTWTPAQIAHFTKFGNARAAQYFEACIPPNFQRPPQGDAMQMERFIRDKYEHKRYITVENGGLGGEVVGALHRPSGSSYSGVLGPRPSQVSGTAAYSVRGYDGAKITRRTGISFNSYGGRFGSRAAERSQGRSIGGILGQTTSGPEIRRGSALQRAGTLKELINMGFSAQHAARAVEAAHGDLQKAVDWVLEHNDEGSRNNMSSFAPPPQQEPQRDLLDFDDPVPTPQVSAKANPSQQSRPKAMDTELLMSTTSSTTAASKDTDDQADFADFGAFESALPAATKPAPEVGNPATNGSLSSTIRNIYKQSPPQRAQPYLNRMPHMTRLDQSKQVTSPQSRPIRTTLSPKLMAQKAAEGSRKIPDTDLGLTSFTGLTKNQHMLSSPTTNAQLSHHPGFHGPTSVKPNGGEVPPPPPPQVEVSVPHMNSSYPSTPPPPDTPPPDSPVPPGRRPNEKTLTSALEPEPKLGLSSMNPSLEQDENETTNSAEQPPPEEEEEEDPFAALSMMAMKSAKTKGTKKNPAPHLSLQRKVGVVWASSEQRERANEDAVTVKPTNDIDLDDLLG